MFETRRRLRETEERLERALEEAAALRGELDSIKARFEARVAERTAALAESNGALDQACARLRASRDALAVAMRGAHIGSWCRDLASNRLTWSAELAQIVGLAPEPYETTEEGFYAYVHEDDHEEVKAAVARAIRERVDYAVTFRFRHASGEWRWMEGRGRAVYAADGTPVSMTGIAIDATERRRQEDELRRINAELVESQRRKDEFLAVLAHELRNPLAPIKNSLTVLKSRPMPDLQMAWARDVVERQVGQMTQLLDDLLDVSRITRDRLEIERQRVELAPLVRAAVEASRPLVDAAGHELTMDVPPEPIYLEADAPRILQVFSNLISNAVKFTERGGRIVVSASVEGREVVLSVKDTGIGIAEAHLGTLFDMFEQTASTLHRAQGGLGIGLALSRALVEKHGGSIMAYSEGAGRGSEFLVRLPLGPVRMVERETDESAAPPLRTACRILVADDNHDAAESLALMLRLAGNEVRTGRDGVEAVSLAESYRPDVALLDIGMPRMNGYDAARSIREAPWGRDIMLIALTGWGQDEDKRRAHEAGFDHHFTKPVDLDALSRLIAFACASSPA